jgi:hypothetical protein
MVDESDNPAIEIYKDDKLHNSLMEAKLWGNIRAMGKTDPGMQDLLNKVKEYYYLRRE